MMRDISRIRMIQFNIMNSVVVKLIIKIAGLHGNRDKKYSPSSNGRLYQLYYFALCTKMVKRPLCMVLMY